MNLQKRTVFLSNPVIEAITPDLAEFGQKIVSKQVLDWVTDAEHNTPYLRGSGRDSFGQKKTELIVSDGWKQLQNLGIEQGYV